MNIGYGESNSSGGHKYVLVLVLVLVDKCTSNRFVYEMHSTSRVDVVEAIWNFVIDAGGLPRTIQFNFDPIFIGGEAISLL